MTEVGSVEGLRAYMRRVHQLDAPDDALAYALQRARSYSGSEDGVYTVASKWIRDAADPGTTTGAPEGAPVD